MKEADSPDIRYYLVRSKAGKLSVIELTERKMSEWLDAHPGTNLASCRTFETHEAAEMERSRLGANRRIWR